MLYYYSLKVTTPAGTLSTAPQATVWPLVDGTLRRLEVMIPSGHSGLTGIAVHNQNTQVVPWGASGFLVADNVTIPIDLDYEVAASGLSIHTYNTGQYAHSHYLRALVETLAPGRDGASAPLTALALPPQLVST